ncbi:MAG: P-loop NTPase, partial [Candidatus Gastranaerophilales bacterium]|nr:P-loop NTPase [Candidatus Gastranaerophilales bacterium]
MANVLVIDGNLKTKEVITSYFNEFEDVSLVGIYENFSSVPSDLDLNLIDIILFDISKENSDDILLQIKNIKSNNRNINFIAASYEINSELVVKTLKEGVDEFLLKPFIKNILNSTIKKIVEKKKDRLVKFGRVLCVFSNKGGVGKTSLATNLAYNIAEATNESTCIFDLSFNQDDVMTSLNLDSKFDFNYILKSLEQADKQFSLSLMPKYKDSKLYALASGKNVEIMQKLSIADIIKTINYLKTIFSYIVIDLPSIIGETPVSIMNEADIILLLGLAN